ncbi:MULTISPECIES: ferredoxin [unclassified Streptomyces]|uniref:ferredoxin n=1 Tax=unclassified Streptomyces TaxID=2593676 RepID=UPI00368DF63A
MDAPAPVRVDRDRCVGSGMCALTAPAVFDQDDEEGRVLLLTPHPAPNEYPAARLAAGLCPASAITLTPRRTTG